MVLEPALCCLFDSLESRSSARNRRGATSDIVALRSAKVARRRSFDYNTDPFP